ncbi:MAG: hypothetical protein AAFQ16_07295 [Pseudomonadota bacterium]
MNTTKFYLILDRPYFSKDAAYHWRRGRQAMQYIQGECKKMNTRIFIQLFIVACLTGCEHRVPAEHAVKEEEHENTIPIESALESPISLDAMDSVFTRESASDIVFALNELEILEDTISGNNNSLYELIHCAYILCAESNAAWSETVKTNPLVRVKMLDVLSQAERNGLIKSLDFDARTEALSYFESTDRAVVAQSIMVLGFRAESQDILRIERFAVDANDEYLFRRALTALAFSPNEEAESALGRVRDLVDGPRQLIVDEIVNATRGMPRPR